MNAASRLQLSYEAQGDGPPVIVLHGLFGSSTNWRSVARTLARNYRVHALDLRNHGKSPHADTMSYQAMSRDVRDFMETQGLTRSHFIGHSMGGKIAMRLALEAPAVIDRLVVVDIAPVASSNDYRPIIDALREIDLAAISRRADADAVLKTHVSQPELRMFLLQNLRRSDDGFKWQIGLDGIADSLTELLDFVAPAPDSRYSGGALFVLGGLSSYVREEHRDAIMKYFPSARIETIANAGHWVHAERPNEFLARVEAFFANA